MTANPFCVCARSFLAVATAIFVSACSSDDSAPAIDAGSDGTVCTHCGALDGGDAAMIPTNDAAAADASTDATTSDATTSDAAGTECSSTDACPSGQDCGYAIADGCAAQGRCFPVATDPLCNAIAPACSCTGTFVNTVCDGYPSGYASAPVAHSGECAPADGG